MKKILLAMLLSLGAFAAQTVVMETTQGTIEIELRPDVAPKACENFIKLSQKDLWQ